MLAPNGVKVVRSLVGNYVTSLDMAGCSITVTLLDDELKGLWDAPVHTAALRWGLYTAIVGFEPIRLQPKPHPTHEPRAQAQRRAHVFNGNSLRPFFAPSRLCG